MILDFIISRDSMLPAFVTLCFWITLSVSCSLPASTLSLLTVYSTGLSLIHLMLLIDQCLLNSEFIIIKLQMYPHSIDPSLQKTTPSDPLQPSPSWRPFTTSPCLAFPEKFNSSPGKRKGFLLQCPLFVNLQLLSYPTDESRVSLVFSLLTGRVLDWATAVWEGECT